MNCPNKVLDSEKVSHQYKGQYSVLTFFIAQVLEMFNQMTLSQTSVDFSWCYRVAIYERANIRQHVFLSLIKMNKPFGLVIELNISLVNCEYWRWRRDPHSIFVNLPTITPHIRKSTATCSSTSLWIPVIAIWVLCGVVFLAAQRCPLVIAYLTFLELL